MVEGCGFVIPQAHHAWGWDEASSTLGKLPAGFCRPAGAWIPISCRPGGYAAGTPPANFLPPFQA
jgi:hypothetical protein